MKIIAKFLILVFIFIFGQMTYSASLQLMTDEQLANVEAQSLLSFQNFKDDSQAINFYKLGFEVISAFNVNAKTLQLGCGGINGANGCDIDIENVSFGCITGASGHCISLPTTLANQPNGVDSNNNIANQQGMKDFILTNPFVQFAIKNADSPSTREVVGLRIGAEKSEGPMSFGSLNSFSGFMTGKANLTMRGQRDVSPVNLRQARYNDASAFLGLEDATIMNGIIAALDYRDVTVNYSTVTRNDLPVSVVGNRVTQAQIQNIQLGGVVDDIMRNLSVERSCVRVVFFGCGGDLGTLVANGLLPILSGGIGNYIKGQLANGLGTSTARLNNYVMPYNLKNVHQIDINSSSFGIALSQQSIKYPDYDVAVPQGWTMYLNDAFKLNINDNVSSLVQNIASTPNARNGDITLLAPAYRNCYGDLKFC